MIKKMGMSILSGAALLTAASQSYAVLITSDSFLFGNPATPAAGEYTASPAGPNQGGGAGSLYPVKDGGQNPTLSGVNGAWTRKSGNTNTSLAATSVWQVVQDNIDHSVQDSEGGSLQFGWPTSFTGQRNLARDLTSPPVLNANQSIYMSTLIHFNETTASLNLDGEALVGFMQERNDRIAAGPTGELQDRQGFRIGLAGDGSEIDLVYRSRVRQGAVGSGVFNEDLVLIDGVQPGDTHFVIAKVTKNASNLLGLDPNEGNDLVQIWVDPSDISNEPATISFIHNDFSLKINNSNPNDAANALRYFVLNGSDIGGSGVQFDEVRLGTTWQDVAVPAPPTDNTGVPEPATSLLSFMGLAGLAMLCGRRNISA